MKIKSIIIIILLATIQLSIIGCNQTSDTDFDERILEYSKEPIEYIDYNSNGISLKYPNWETIQNKPEGVGVSVTKEFCTVTIDQKDMPLEHYYRAMAQAVSNSPDYEYFGESEKNKFIKYTGWYKNKSTINEVKFFECNEFTTTVTIACMLSINDQVNDMKNTIFDSIQCVDHSHFLFGNIDYLKEEGDLLKSDLITTRLDDFSLTHPDWNVIKNDKILTVTDNNCAVITTAFPWTKKDLQKYIINTIKSSPNNKLGETIEKDNMFTIKMNFDFDNKTYTTTNNGIYCNHNTYITSVVCEEGSDNFEKLENYVIQKCRDNKILDVLTKDFNPLSIDKKIGYNITEIIQKINNNHDVLSGFSKYKNINFVVENQFYYEYVPLKIQMKNGKVESITEGQFETEDVFFAMPKMDFVNWMANMDEVNSDNINYLIPNLETEPVEEIEIFLNNIRN